MNAVKHTLLIDDDPISLFVCETMITKNAFAEKVTSFKNGRDALNYLQHTLAANGDPVPEIIFLDINMPMLTGWDFLDEAEETLRNLKPHPQVIMLSSTFDPQDFEKSKTYNLVVDFISKPLTTEDLAKLRPSAGQ